MIELYHFWSSVCSVRCRMALEEKGVEWVSRYIDLFKLDQLKPEYLALNPDGVVPTLVHDGAPIVDSSVICEYLDEVFPAISLTPADPVRRRNALPPLRSSESLRRGPSDESAAGASPHALIEPREHACASCPDHPGQSECDQVQRSALGERPGRSPAVQAQQQREERATGQ